MSAWHFVILGILLSLPTPATGITPTEPTTLPIRFQDGLVWVSVHTDAHPAPLQFLLDSGASISVLDQGTARDLGLRLGSKTPVAGVGTRTSGHGPIPWTGKAGSVDLPSEVLVLNLERLAVACGRPVNGLVGADFFRDRIIEVDYAAETLRLLPESPSPGTLRAVPLGVTPRGLSVLASVNGGLQQTLRVDTGCASALQWVSSETSGRLCPGSPTVGLARLSVPQTLTGIRLGPHQVDTVATGLHRKPIFADEAGLLGNGLLAMFGCVTFDSPAGLLHLGKGSHR